MKRGVIGIVCAWCSIVLLLYSVVVEFSHPEWSAAESVNALWWPILLAVVLWGLAWWGLSDSVAGRK
jgi:hypothetical protein